MMFLYHHTKSLDSKHGSAISEKFLGLASDLAVCLVKSLATPDGMSCCCSQVTCHVMSVISKSAREKSDQNCSKSLAADLLPAACLLKVAGSIAYYYYCYYYEYYYEYYYCYY